MPRTIQDKNLESSVERIKGTLYEVIKIKGDDGNVIRTFQIPLKVEIKLKDILEIIVGSSILAIPVAFTEEVWDLGQNLNFFNVLILSFIGFMFMAAFVYFSAYRLHMKMFRKEFLIRVFTIYILSLLVVGLLLTVIGQCPWLTDFDVAIKRVMIGAFPASMSATVTDSLD